MSSNMVRQRETLKDYFGKNIELRMLLYVSPLSRWIVPSAQVSLHLHQPREGSIGRLFHFIIFMLESQDSDTLENVKNLIVILASFGLSITSFSQGTVGVVNPRLANGIDRGFALPFFTELVSLLVLSNLGAIAKSLVRCLKELRVCLIRIDPSILPTTIPANILSDSGFWENLNILTRDQLLGFDPFNLRINSSSNNNNNNTLDSDREGQICETYYVDEIFGEDDSECLKRNDEKICLAGNGISAQEQVSSVQERNSMAIIPESMLNQAMIQSAEQHSNQIHTGHPATTSFLEGSAGNNSLTTPPCAKRDFISPIGFDLESFVVNHTQQYQPQQQHPQKIAENEQCSFADEISAAMGRAAQAVSTKQTNDYPKKNKFNEIKVENNIPTPSFGRDLTNLQQEIQRNMSAKMPRGQQLMCQIGVHRSPLPSPMQLEDENYPSRLSHFQTRPSSQQVIQATASNAINELKNPIARQKAHQKAKQVNKKQTQPITQNSTTSSQAEQLRTKQTGKQEQVQFFNNAAGILSQGTQSSNPVSQISAYAAMQLCNNDTKDPNLMSIEDSKRYGDVACQSVKPISPFILQQYEETRNNQVQDVVNFNSITASGQSEQNLRQAKDNQLRKPEVAVAPQTTCEKLFAYIDREQKEDRFFVKELQIDSQRISQEGMERSNEVSTEIKATTDDRIGFTMLLRCQDSVVRRLNSAQQGISSANDWRELENNDDQPTRVKESRFGFGKNDPLEQLKTLKGDFVQNCRSINSNDAIYVSPFEVFGKGQGIQERGEALVNWQEEPLAKEQLIRDIQNSIAGKRFDNLLAEFYQNRSRIFDSLISVMNSKKAIWGRALSQCGSINTVATVEKRRTIGNTDKQSEPQVEKLKGKKYSRMMMRKLISLFNGLTIEQKGILILAVLVFILHAFF